jgi:holliday junction DNA helicase RuvB
MMNDMKRIHELIGLTRIKELVAIDIAACKHTDEPFPHSLLWGVGGTGKTELANAISTELNYRFKVVEGASLKSKEQIHSLLISLSDGYRSDCRRAVLYIDEVHRLSRVNQECFYYPMAEWRIISENGVHRLMPFTILASTTRIDLLDAGSFMTRFQNKWEITPYHKIHICEILSKYFDKQKITYVPEILNDIASRCLGIPRNAISLAKKMRNYILSKRRRNILPTDCGVLFRLERIDENGLSELHVRYLHALADTDKGLSLGSVASMLGQHEDTVYGHIEPVLLHLGLVVRGRGRQITNKGKNYLQKVQIPS